MSIASVAAMLTAPTPIAHAVEASAPAPALPRDSWQVHADSEQEGSGLAKNAIDGDPATAWHTQHTPTAAPLPHNIYFDTWNNEHVISGLRYKPRNDGNRNGNIGRYEIRVSTDYGESRIVATGTFADDATEKTVLFPPAYGNRVRLAALTEAGNRGPWSSAAEVNILGYVIHPVPRTGWTVTADSEHGDFPARNAVDGDPATIWQTADTATPLPHSLTIDLHTSRIISGFRYVPRTDRFDGRIGDYRLTVSADGSAWVAPVATGTFADDNTEKTVVFSPASARFVRLTALTEAGNRGPWASAAEIDLIGYGYPDLAHSRTGWTITADSEQQSGGLASYAIDSNLNTVWHTRFTPTNAPLPHTFAIDMHTTNTVSGLRYRPRTDGNLNGNIGQYQIHVSLDGSTWGSPVATGAFADDNTEKIVVFQPVVARFARLTALTEAGNRGPWTSAAEINLTDNQLADLQCTPSTPIYTTRSNGAFVRYQHLEPETGLNSWTTQQQIATGFGTDARRIAGPDGVIYSAVNNGELWRRRWNGSGWDTFPNGLTYEVIDRNPVWASFSDVTHPATANYITVDTRGDIYTLEFAEDNHGYFWHWRRYDPATHTMAHRIIGPDFSDPNFLFAAGPGVLYRRHGFPHGGMSRLEYDVDSQRWRRNEVDGDWRAFRRFFSPGGDVFYGVRDTGDLMWFRFNPETSTLANGFANNEPFGLRIGTGWQNDYETIAAPDACRLVGTRPFVRPAVTAVTQAPVTLALSSNGHLHYSYADPEGRAIYAEAADLTGGTPIRLAAIPGMTDLAGPTSVAENQDGRIQVAGTGIDAEIRSNTQTTSGGTWGPAVSLGGFVTRPTTLVRMRNDEIMAIAADERSGFIWTRKQEGPNGPFGWLMCNGDRVEPRVDHSSLTVIPTDYQYTHYMRIIGLDRNGTFHARSNYEIFPDEECRRLYYQQATWQSLGGSGFDGPAAAILMPDNTLQVFATGPDGVVYTQRETAIGFPGTWTTVSAGLTASGAPSAIMAPDGMFKIVVRGIDGSIYYTSQTAAGAATFTPWQAIPDTEESATDPTALAVPSSNTWVVAYRTDLDVPKLRRYVPGLLVASSSPFMDVPLTPPT